MQRIGHIEYIHPRHLTRRDVCGKQQRAVVVGALVAARIYIAEHLVATRATLEARGTKTPEELGVAGVALGGAPAVDFRLGHPPLTIGLGVRTRAAHGPRYGCLHRIAVGQARSAKDQEDRDRNARSDTRCMYLSH